MIDKRKIYQKAIEYYGSFEQHSVAMEECGELIQAISKFMRATKPSDMLIARNHIKEEMADVLIMIGQLQEMHSIDNKELEKEVDYKLARLNERIDYGAD